MNTAERIEKIHKNETILLDYLKEIDSKLPESDKNYNIKDALKQLNIDIQLVSNDLYLRKLNLDIKENEINSNKLTFEKEQQGQGEKLTLSNFPFFNIKHYRSGSSEKKVSFALSGYQELSYLLNDILEVAIVAIESEGEQVKYSVAQVLKLVKNLIPEEEFKLLDNLHTPIVEKDYSKYIVNE